MLRATTFTDWLLLTFLVAAWGSAFVMMKVAVTHLDAAWVMALRLAVAALLLIPYSLIAGEKLAAPPGVWGKFTWLGFIGHALPFFLISWGTFHVSSGVSGLLMAAIPLSIIVLAHLFLPDEPLTLPKTVGFLLGFVGIVILIGPDRLLGLSFEGHALAGQIAILAGCLCYAIHAITAQRLGFETPVKQAAGVCLAAALMGVIFAVATSPAGLVGKPPIAFLAVAGLGVVPTALATLVMYRLLSRMGPSFVAYSNYLVPPFAVVLGAIILGERLDWRIGVALVLILGGIAITRLPPGEIRPSN